MGGAVRGKGWKPAARLRGRRLQGAAERFGITPHPLPLSLAGNAGDVQECFIQKGPARSMQGKPAECLGHGGEWGQMLLDNPCKPAELWAPTETAPLRPFSRPAGIAVGLRSATTPDAHAHAVRVVQAGPANQHVLLHGTAPLPEALLAWLLKSHESITLG